MRKLIILLILCAIVLVSCIETLTHTTIKKDGSGQVFVSLDMSEAMKMMAAGKTGENFNMDTVIYLRNHSDTSSILTDRQKALLRDMTIQMRMDMRKIEELKFKFSITAPFKSLKDLNELNELMKKKEYDAVFDKAMVIPMLEDKDKSKEDGMNNDNIFGSLVPAFFKCDYKQGSIDCSVDEAAYKEAKEGMAKMEFDINGEKGAGNTWSS